METTRTLPDPNSCRTKQLESGTDAYWCLVDNPFECAYAKKFGSTDAYFCNRNSDDYGNPD
jgi:hypothetical protein